jgi:phage regulator Rha-like protein
MLNWKLNSKQVILDRDVATLYNVGTKEVNQSVKNNPDKFPDGFIFELSKSENEALRSKILTLKKSSRGKHPKYPPKAFTEQGLYMLATILKGDVATQTTIAIVQAFAKLREITRTFAQMATTTNPVEQQQLTARGSNMLSSLIGDNMELTEDELSLEMNLLTMFKIKRTFKRKKKFS